ncbi:MAG: universal stress protein [Bacteroidia bacterium]|nr:universal stress protein [Bacteroidia bacterium]
MHRIIIPVDFSENSLNAVHFAKDMLAEKNDALAILYHNYEKKNELAECTRKLEDLKKELLDKGVAAVDIEKEMGGDLIENISRLAHTARATLVVMGIKSRSTVHHVFFGSNTLKLINENLYPVMIIPPKIAYSEIRNVAFASDFKDVEATTPSTLISSVLEMFNPMLHIVNVNPEHYVSITEEYQECKEQLIEMFKNYKTEFYFIGMTDFFEAMDNFIRDYKIDLLVTIPKHDSNARLLFSNTHTKKLAYHSKIPILAAHE